MWNPVIEKLPIMIIKNVIYINSPTHPYSSGVKIVVATLS